MLYDQEAKKLYTVGLVGKRTQVLDNGRQMEVAVLLLNDLNEIKQFTGDDLCLDQGTSAAIDKRTNALWLVQLLTLFSSIFFAWF